MKETPSNRVIYAELISTLLIVAMVCGTLLTTTSMWVNERAAEVSFLRGVP